MGGREVKGLWWTLFVVLPTGGRKSFLVLSKGIWTPFVVLA